MSPPTYEFRQLFFLCVIAPQFFLRMWVAFIFKSPWALFWVFASQLLVEKTITLDCTTVYQSLYTEFSWFCSFHSASVPGGYSSSHGTSSIHYSFQHNSIPSPTYTTICSAIPQLKDIPSFSNFFCHHKEYSYKYFYTSYFTYDLFGGINSAVVWLGQRADSLL